MGSDSRLRQAVGRARRLAMSVPLLAAVLLAGCAPGRNLPPLGDAAASAYRLGPGDAVHISVFGDNDLTGDYHVSDTGGIELPLGGTFMASGKTTGQVAAEIASTLKNSKVLTDPHVAVSVTAYRPIFVLGEVKTPGSYPYQPGMTVLTAVAVAGGYTYRAYDSYAEVVRNNDGTAVDARAEPQTIVQPGDVIRVLERNF